MIESAVLERRGRWLGLTGWTTLFIAYTLIFWAFSDDGLASGVQRALINTLPAALLSWPVVRLVERYLIDAGLVIQSLGHLGLGIGFGLLWYIGIQIGYGLQAGWVSDGIVGRPLLGIALTWQLFQGMTLYAVVALFAYAMTYRLRLASLQAERGQVKAEPSAVPQSRQIFLKDGKTIRPTPLADILLLSGAGDYTEVVTRDATFLSTTSLNTFETELPSDSFLRVHRSHIVRTDAILSVESGGNGRLTLHLPKGQSLTTSRAGAIRLRDRAF